MLSGLPSIMYPAVIDHLEVFGVVYKFKNLTLAENIYSDSKKHCNN